MAHRPPFGHHGAMQYPTTPTLWLEMSGSVLPTGSRGSVEGPGVDCMRVAAWTTNDSSGSPVVEIGPVGHRGGLLGGLRRSSRRGCVMNDLLEGIGGSIGLAVIPSDGETALGVVAEARRRGMLERLWVTSADLAVLDAVREDSPATRLLHACDPTDQPRGAERHAAVLREHEIQGVMVPADRVGAGLVALMHRFGRTIGADGTEYVRMVRAALASGVDIVCGPSAAVLREGKG